MATDTSSPQSLPTRGITLGARAASVYDWLEPLMMFGRMGSLVTATVAAIEPMPGQSFLDIGCGTGLFAAALAEEIKEGKVIGVDASGPMIYQARKKRTSAICSFEVALAEELPFEDQYFDGVVSSMFFHHLPMDLKTKCMDEISRILRPGGNIAIADIDTPWSIFGTLYGYGGYVFFRQPEIKENLDGVMPTVLGEAGLIDVEPVYATLGCVRIWRGRKPC